MDDAGRVLTTRSIVISGVLAAVSVLLAATRIGFIPTPTGIAATILHIPAIIGGVLEGPLVGAIIGTIFGLYSFFYATVPLFKDPIVAILPRIFIGIFAAYAYRAARPAGEVTAIVAAAVVGTATNTVLVLGFGVLRHYIPGHIAVKIAATQGVVEAIVAALVCLAVLVPWKRVQRGQARARI